MLLSFQLRPLLAYTKRDTADVQPEAADQFYEICNGSVPVDTARAAMIKLWDIASKLHGHVATLAKPGAATPLAALVCAPLMWSQSCTATGDMLVQAQLPRPISQHEYHCLCAQLEHMLRTELKAPLQRNVILPESGAAGGTGPADRNVLLSVKSEMVGAAAGDL